MATTYTFPLHFEYKTLKGAYHQRKYSPRKTEYLPTNADKLFFILIYLKNNPLQEHHAAAFGLTQDMANKWIHLLINILDVTIQPPHELTFIHRFGPHPSSPPKVRVPFAKVDLEYQYTY